MAEFLGYGILIFIGLFVGLMLWRRVRGHDGGCCGDCGHQYAHEATKNDEQRIHRNTSCH